MKLQNHFNNFLQGTEDFNWNDKKILLVSLHKSGTHLIDRILKLAGLKHQLFNQNYNLQDFYLLKKNEYIRSHFPPKTKVCELIEQKKIRVIFNFRDPRDVCVSKYNWHSHKNQRKTSFYNEFKKKVNKKAFKNKEEHLNAIIRGDRYGSSIFELRKMYLEARDLLFHPYVHKTRFEDLIGSLGGGDKDRQINAITDLFNFLEIEDKDPEEIAKKAYFKKSNTFYKGQIGRYKKEFTKEQIRLFEELHGDILRDYGYMD